MIDRLKNFGWLGAEEVVRLGLGFAVTLMLANHLGSAQFGAYGYLFSFVALFIPVIAFGLPSLVARYTVEQPERLGAILQVAMTIQLASALLAFALAMGLMALLPAPEGTTLTLAAIAGISLLVHPGTTPNTMFKALEQVRIVAIPRVIVTMAIAVVSIMFILQDRPLAYFVGLRSAEVVGMALVAMIALVVRRPGGIRLAPQFDWQLARQFIHGGFPLMLSGLAGLIYMRIDQVMLGQLGTIEALGQYTIAVRFSDAAVFVPMALQAAFFPALVRAARRDESAYRQELGRFFDIMSLAMWSLVIGVILGGSLIIMLVLDPAYADSAAMLAILAFGLPFIGLGVARSCHLTIRSWFWTSTIMTAVGAVANIALNFLLIPGYGGIGAAVASVISYWIAAHAMCYAMPWTRDLGRGVLRALNPLGAAARLAVLYRSRHTAGVTDVE